MNAPPPTVKEDEFQTEIMRLARLLHWHVFHVNDSRREVVDRRRGFAFLVGDEDTRGWPDLVLAHPRWHIFAVRELKTNKGRVTPHQRQWIEVLTESGVDVAIWRPRDWDELIVPFLTNRRALRAA